MGKHEAPDPLDDDTAAAELLNNVADYWRERATKTEASLVRLTHHLDFAHNAIHRLRQELHTLNDVILRRKRTAKRQRKYVDAVNELHRPVDGRQLDNTTCREDSQPWPCRTHHALETVAMETLKALVQEEKGRTV